MGPPAGAFVKLRAARRAIPRGMCGRFTLTNADVRALVKELCAELDRARPPPDRPRWNVAPSDLHLLVRLEQGRRLLLPARFGWAGRRGAPLLNARAETAAHLPTFRGAWRIGRCLVPADGFYEWMGPARARRPHWYHRPDGALLLLAGLCREEPGGLSFAILTTAANAVVRPAHDRMPALLSREAAERWLAEAEPGPLLPAPDDWLLATEVSPRVNAVANDDPACLEPPPPPAQGSLF
jgi:putative SOS response-associated peptidase YedK